MSSRRNRLFAALLAVLVALGPAGNALAMRHTCGGGTPTAEQHAVHMQMDADTPDATAQARQASSGCHDCLPECCKGSTCSANGCGHGIAAVINTFMSPPDSYANVVSPAKLPTILSEQLTSLFRPPRT